MAYFPISGTVPQYAASGSALADGYYLKGYVAGTTTPLSMATDSAGATLLAKCKLNADGNPIANSGDESSEFVPHFNQNYKLALFTSEADADANNTGNAKWVVDNLSGSGSGTTFATLTAAKAATLLGDGSVIHTHGYATAGDGGAGTYRYDAAYTRS